MARIRSIKPAFFTSEDTCACSPLARLLLLGLLTEADKVGRVEDRPRQIKRRVLPDDDCEVDALLGELANHQLVRRYRVGEVSVIQILNFSKHQRPHPKEPDSQLPAEEPCLNTASRDQKTISPVDYPSTPARSRSSDLGSGDLGSGDLGAGAGATTPPPAPQPRTLISGAAHPGTWGKLHSSHVTGFCDSFVCFPDSVFEDFVKRVMLGGCDRGEASQQVKDWALNVKTEWQRTGQIPGDDIFDFWRHEWKKTNGSNKPTAGGVDVLAGFR